MNCPACGRPAKMSRLFVFRDGVRRGLPPLETVECAICTHRFMATDEAAQTLIEAVYEHGYAGHEVDPVFEQKLAQAIEEDIAPRLRPGARVLDVGCGNGAFLEAMQARGYAVEGIDISTSIVTELNARGIPARHGDFLVEPYEGTFDLITFWDVLEHLRNPSDFIGRAAGLLSPGGWILAKTPGFGRGAVLACGAHDALARRVLSAPNHIQYFNRRSMDAMLGAQRLDSVHWLASRGFRGKKAGGGLKKKAARAVGNLIGRYGGNANLYFVATATPPRETV